ncbi:MAG TPA: helix-turn-helix transcriptional regulator [Stellaceae bacterium]|nr:helix-turn-helix transcriptional regulator [Stellaceae bacterium]
MHGTLDLAAVAALAGDPARAAMLTALFDGRARTAGELAFFAGVKGPTASGHLARLEEGRLVTAMKQGRNRYYRLANAAVAHMLESIMAVAAAGPPRHRPHSRADDALRAARTCYDHLAGKLGVALTDALMREGHIVLGEDGGEVTERGVRFLDQFGAGIAEARRARRAFCRPCLDWTERRPHLGGAVGAAIATRAFDLDWVERQRDGRALTITEKGRAGFAEIFGATLEAP